MTLLKIYTEENAAREHLESLNQAECLGSRGWSQHCFKEALLGSSTSMPANALRHIANISGKTLRPIVVQQVSRKSSLMIDTADSYGCWQRIRTVRNG